MEEDNCLSMSSINGSPISVPIERSERNEYYCTSEEEIQRLVTEDINKKMVEAARKTQSKFSSASIYRVPEEIRKLKESAYTPRFVSVGPLHSKDPHILKSLMQDVKMSYVDSLFGRIWSLEKGGSEEQCKSTVLMECVSEMRKVLDEAKKCYAEEVDDQLTEQMLVIDGCFILELLYVNYHGKPNDVIDPILDSILMPIYVRHDLLLLENQLPFFVLNKLFDLTVAHIAGARQGTLTDYVIPYFGNIWDSGNNRTTLPPPPPPKNNEYCHILHVLHNHYAKPQEQNPDSLVMPCASDLDYAGVKFRVGTEVRFQNPEGPFDRAYFEIPKLKLYDSTEPFLRNLIAFEQCCHGDVIKRYFTSYAVLLDTLINTQKDVQVLEKAKIIDNYLGASEDATLLFNNLCKGVVIEKYYFGITTKAAAQYSERCWSDAMAHLRRKYFASPWTFLAFCAGFITFGISLIKFGVSVFKFIHNHTL